MPLELIVLGFVIVAFVAIAARFLPRDAPGGRRLPRIIDESIGMYVLRRSVGRSTEAASDRAKSDAEASARVSEDEIAHRIGIPGAPEPTTPTRYVASSSQPQAHQVAPVVPITTRPPVGGRPQARRRGLLVTVQRRLAALGTVAAIVLVAFAASSFPRVSDEAVLSATGTPAASEAAVPSPTSSPTEAAVPSSPPTTAPPPSPSAAAPTSPPPSPTATPRRTPPAATPRPTQRSTPPPTAPPTPAPTPPPSDEPSAPPSEEPTPPPSDEPSAPPSEAPPVP